MPKTTEELLEERDHMLMLANGGAVGRANIINGMLMERGVLDENGNRIDQSEPPPAD